MPVSPIHQFADDVRRIAPVGDEALAAVAALMAPRDLAASAWLLEAGQRAQWGFYIVEGLVREFYVDAHGEEHTRAFADAGRFTGSLLDLFSDRPSVTWVQALEPTRVLAFRYSAFDALCARWPDLNMLARRIAEQLYVRKAQREYELLALPAAERYAQWRRRNPALDARISKRVLASFLGITPEHLSRLRRTPVPAGSDGHAD